MGDQKLNADEIVFDKNKSSEGENTESEAAQPLSDSAMQDRSERGDSSAERSDTVKYQFERPGTFTLADTTIVWWDADAG